MTTVASNANASTRVNPLYGATTNTVQGSQTPGKTGTTGATSTDPAQAQDRFLKLLVAQLNNQDPMNPMDNAQMTSQLAQINTVTGIQQLNQTVTSLMSQFASMQVMQSSGLVGHEVLVDGSTLTLDGTSGKGGVSLAKSAQDVSVKVLDARGNVVKTQSLGRMSAGNHAFNVNLSDVGATGPYTFKVVASNGSQTVDAGPLMRDKVVSISTGAQGVTLDMAGSPPVPYASLRSVL